MSPGETSPHPVIKEYFQNGGTKIHRVFKSQSLSPGMTHLLKVLQKFPYQKVPSSSDQKKLQETDLKHIERGLELFFLYCRIQIASLFKGLNELESIFNLASSFYHEKCNPYEKVLFKWSWILLLKSQPPTEKNIFKFKQLHQEIYQLEFEGDSIRDDLMINELFFLITTHQCDLETLNKYYAEFKNFNLPEDEPSWKIIFLCFYAESGNLEKAKEYRDLILSDTLFLRKSNLGVLTNYWFYLNLMKEILDLKNSHPKMDDLIKNMPKVLRESPFYEYNYNHYHMAVLLINGEPEKAKKIFNSFDDILSIHQMEGIYCRIELSRNNWQEPLRFLNQWGKNGISVDGLSFLLARAEYQAGNHRKAAGHFQKYLEFIRKYKSHRILEFELKLAPEIKASELYELTRQEIFLPGKRRGERNPAHEIPNLSALDQLVGQSSVLTHLKEEVKRYGPTEISVLIVGETGTGKELVARALHDESERSEKPFHAINCGAISENLLESELFGHTEGAFTGAVRGRKGIFEEAGGGTLMLDEIGDISPRLQVALLRVLETMEVRPLGSSRSRPIHCRILAVTHQDLSALVEKGEFREDLFFRLKRLELLVPPLRKRENDPALLAEHFLNQERLGPPVKLGQELSIMLNQMEWPGNVRELKNAIEKFRLFHSLKLKYDLGDWLQVFPNQHTHPLSQSLSISQSPSQSKAKAKSNKLPPTPEEIKKTPVPSDFISHPKPLKKEIPIQNVQLILATGNTRLRKLETLRKLFSQYPVLTRMEISRILKISPPTATQYLKQLCKEGLIVKKKPSASPQTHYFQFSGESI